MTYYLHNGQLFEIDRMPPSQDNAAYLISGTFDYIWYGEDLNSFHTYLSTLQPIEQEGLTGDGVKVLDKDFKWAYRNIPVHESGAVAKGLTMVAVPICKRCKGTGWDIHETATTVTPIICPDCTAQSPTPELPNLSASAANRSKIKDRRGGGRFDRRCCQRLLPPSNEGA